METAIQNPLSSWHELKVGDATVADHLEGVASRGAFEQLIVDPWVEEWDEDDYVDLVDKLYGRLAIAADKATLNDLRIIGARNGAGRQQRIEDFIFTNCGECGSKAEYIFEKSFRFSSFPSGIEEKYEEMKDRYDNVNLYRCQGCESYLVERE